jgi:flagellar hook-length control protein FliK
MMSALPYLENQAAHMQTVPTESALQTGDFTDILLHLTDLPATVGETAPESEEVTQTDGQALGQINPIAPNATLLTTLPNAPPAEPAEPRSEQSSQTIQATPTIQSEVALLPSQRENLQDVENSPAPPVTIDASASDPQTSANLPQPTANFRAFMERAPVLADEPQTEIPQSNPETAAQTDQQLTVNLAKIQRTETQPSSVLERLPVLQMLPQANLQSVPQTGPKPSAPQLTVAGADVQWSGQLATELAVMVRDVGQMASGKNMLAFQMKPAELGMLHISVLTTEGEPHVILSADNDNARQILSGSQNRLEQDLRHQAARSVRVTIEPGDLAGTSSFSSTDQSSAPPPRFAMPARVGAMSHTAMDEIQSLAGAPPATTGIRYA